MSCTEYKSISSNATFPNAFRWTDQERSNIINCEWEKHRGQVIAEVDVVLRARKVVCHSQRFSHNLSYGFFVDLIGKRSELVWQTLAEDRAGK
jgi:hypothetical protein